MAQSIVSNGGETRVTNSVQPESPPAACAAVLRAAPCLGLLLGIASGCDSDRVGPRVRSTARQRLERVLISASRAGVFLLAYRSYRGALYLGSFLVVSTVLQWVTAISSSSAWSLLAVLLGSPLTLLIIAFGIRWDRRWRHKREYEDTQVVPHKVTAMGQPG